MLYKAGRYDIMQVMEARRVSVEPCGGFIMLRNQAGTVDEDQ